jgi:hypothetical protein
MTTQEETAPTTLYHYCSTETFVSILTSKTIRLSAATLSNDSMEGQIFKKVLMDIASSEHLPYDQLPQFDMLLRDHQDIVEGLIFCLSYAGDLLSQWRAYANNGAGIAIGFNIKVLQKLVANFENPAYMVDIEYDKREQISGLSNVYDSLKPLIQRGALKPPPEQALGLLAKQKTEGELLAELASHSALKDEIFKASLMELIELYYSFKSDAFVEEAEARIVCPLNMPITRTHPFIDISYRAIEDCIIPFAELDFSAPEYKHLINEVVLGPKNRTPIRVIQDIFSNSDGHHKKTLITRSSASYR